MYVAVAKRNSINRFFVIIATANVYKLTILIVVLTVHTNCQSSTDDNPWLDHSVPYDGSL
jgi:hypothetical protein